MLSLSCAEVSVLSLKFLFRFVQSTCWSICRFWVLCLSLEFLFRVVQSTCWSLCRFWVLCLRIERRWYLVRRLAVSRVYLGAARLSSWCFLACHQFVPIQEVAGANQSWGNLGNLILGLSCSARRLDELVLSPSPAAVVTACCRRRFWAFSHFFLCLLRVYSFLRCFFRSLCVRKARRWGDLDSRCCRIWYFGRF
jgi:hypothetical protein